jgi:hypothetical protein|tara:strand:+ start:385 stop:714 length:330 start_codon:yes stop_codon:yes gene_type:complete
VINPFVTLNIPLSSNENEIKRAFRNKAKKFHPDLCKEENASEKFKLVLEAYELLKKNNWRWSNEINNKIDLNKIYKDFIRKNPIYAYYFDLEILKTEAIWDSLRNKPKP